MRFLPLHRVGAATLLSIALIAPARSQGQLVAPAGWQKTIAGGQVTFSQPSTRSRLEIKPLLPLGGELRSWFEAQVARDGRQRGALVSSGPLKRSGRALTVLHQFRDQAVVYVGYPVGTRGRLVVSSAPDANTLASSLSELNDLGAKLGALDTASQRGAQPTGGPKVAKSGPVAKLAPVAARGTLKSGQILGVYLAENYTFGVGGIMIMRYDPILLLRDGSARRNLEVPPLDLNLRADHAAHARDWGRWTRSGAKYIARWNAKDKDELKASFKTTPARAGQTLSRDYSSMGGGGNTALGGDVMTFYSNSYAFAPNGTFTSGRSGGGMSSSVTATSSSKNAGRYRLDGHALTLRFNDGKVVRRLFYFYPDDKGKHDVIGIGDDAFIHDDD